MRIRAATPADAQVAAELVIAVDLAEIGEVDYSLADLHDEWNEHGFDLARDAAVVEDDGGTPIAYAHFRGNVDVMAAVDPRRQGEGAGTALLAWVETRGRERGASRLRQAIGDRGTAGRALLAANGWAPVRSFWRMERDVSPGETADESGLRELRDTDAPALHAIAEAAFAADGAYQSQSLATWTQREFGAHGLDYRLSRVAERSGEPIGFALARRWEDAITYVPLLAVRPQDAGQGLGGRLLRAVFAAAGAAGQRSVRLNVASDNPNAVRLYERVGMSQRWRVDDYQKPLPDYER
jgi:ribosomal protein S18 acetylase RimI-like enzyme